MVARHGGGPGGDNVRRVRAAPPRFVADAAGRPSSAVRSSRMRRVCVAPRNAAGADRSAGFGRGRCGGAGGTGQLAVARTPHGYAGRSSAPIIRSRGTPQARGERRFDAGGGVGTFSVRPAGAGERDVSAAPLPPTRLQRGAAPKSIRSTPPPGSRPSHSSFVSHSHHRPRPHPHAQQTRSRPIHSFHRSTSIPPTPIHSPHAHQPGSRPPIRPTPTNPVHAHPFVPRPPTRSPPIHCPTPPFTPIHSSHAHLPGSRPPTRFTPIHSSHAHLPGSRPPIRPTPIHSSHARRLGPLTLPLIFLSQ
nr:vegetative cell wall protein gp1-like [Penaeus vannamei]